MFINTKGTWKGDLTLLSPSTLEDVKIQIHTLATAAQWQDRKQQMEDITLDIMINLFSTKVFKHV